VTAQLDPGEIEVVVTHPQHPTKSETVTLAAGASRVLTIDLTETDDIVTPPPPLETPDSKPPTPGAVWLFSGVAVGSALTSATFFALGISDQNQLESFDANRQTMDRPADYDDIRMRSNQRLVIGYVGAGVAAAGLAAALLWPRGKKTSDEGASAGVMVVPGGGAVRVKVRF